MREIIAAGGDFTLKGCSLSGSEIRELLNETEGGELYVLKESPRTRYVPEPCPPPCTGESKRRSTDDRTRYKYKTGKCVVEDEVCPKHYTFGQMCVAFTIGAATGLVCLLASKRKQ